MNGEIFLQFSGLKKDFFLCVQLGNISKIIIMQHNKYLVLQGNKDRTEFLHVHRGKSLLESWVSTFLPD